MIKFSKKRLIISVGLSVLAHIVLSVIFATMPGEVGGGAGKPSDLVTIVPRPETMAKMSIKPIKELKADKGVAIKKKKKTKQELARKAVYGRDCEKDGWYGGIGVHQDGQVIQAVVPGYAAHRNGVLAGDLVLEPSPEEVRGEPGSVIKMKIMRDEQVITLHFERERICMVRRVAE